MGRLTIRASDDLVARVGVAAQNAGCSVNDYVTLILDSAIDPNQAHEATQGIRERLARAGLLAPAGAPHARLDAERVAAARAAAGSGTALSTFVSSGRA